MLPAETTDDEQLLAMTAAAAAAPRSTPAPGGERPVPPSPAAERPAIAAPPRAKPAGSSPSAATAASSPIEEEFETIDFYIQQGMFDEAREELGEILRRYPNHPLVLAKLREVEEASGTGAAPPVPAVPLAAAPPPVPPAPPPVPPAPPPAPEPAPAPKRAPAGAPPAVVAGLAVAGGGGGGGGARPMQQVDAKDFETHYDLGIAYKEMGLFADAIREFELILETPGKEVLCYTMIGLCYSAKGQQSEAISNFKKGLYVEPITDMETISLYYELGAAYERLNDAREALYYFEKVLKRDPRFRDVEQRVVTLKQLVAGAGSGGRSGGNGGGEGANGGRDAEVDAAFDGLLDPDGGKSRN